MAGINPNAEHAREHARHGDGKFGAQHRPEGVPLSTVSAEPSNTAPAFVDVGSADGDPVLAGFNSDGTVDIETGDGAVRISDDDIARLYAASLEAKRARHRATLVVDAPVTIVRNGLGDEYGTVVGHRPDGDFVDVRRSDGRLIAYPSASLRLTE